MQVSFQNLLWATASTIFPRARSLSATDAFGVGIPGTVPEVWSFGSSITIKLGKLSFFSNWCSSLMHSSALHISGTILGKPTKLGHTIGLNWSIVARAFIRVFFSPFLESV